MLAELAGGRIGVLGFGREGRAFADALFARHPQADLTIFDEQAVVDVPPNAELHTGALNADRLRELDTLIRSPGLSVDHPALQAARQSGVNIVNSSTIWFAERPDARVVAVTGSKGKSTTAALIAHLAAGCGLTTVLAGNIGDPLIRHLETQADLFVVELSSYQLADLRGRPALGVITRLFPEHIDWHGTFEAYGAAKLRLIELLAGNPLIVNDADPVLRDHTLGAPGRIGSNRADGLHGSEAGLYAAGDCLVPTAQLPLVGAHNAGNIALAVVASEQLGFGRHELLQVLQSFRPLPHRLQVHVDATGRRWINDSIATSPHATRAALEALHGEEILLIAGGFERGADWSVVFEWLVGHPLKALIALPDNGTRIAAEAEQHHTPLAGRILRADDLATAVDAAYALAGDDSVILLSPGAPSFPHFRDFEERGRRFLERVGSGR